MVEKVRAAVEARRGGDLLIIARTRARTPSKGSTPRSPAPAPTATPAPTCCSSRQGADEREVEAIASAFPNTPLALQRRRRRGARPSLPLDRLGELGCSLVLRPVATLFAAARAVQEMLRADRTTMRFDEFTDLIGLPELQALEDHLAG